MHTAQHLRVGRCVWSRTKIGCLYIIIYDHICISIYIYIYIILYVLYFFRIRSLTASAFGNWMFHPGLRDQGIMSETHCQFMGITLYEPTWLPGCRAFFGSSKRPRSAERPCTAKGQWDTKWMENGNWELCESLVETEVSTVWWLPLGLPAARSTMREMLSHCHTAEMLWSDDQEDQQVNEVGII